MKKLLFMLLILVCVTPLVFSMGGGGGSSSQKTYRGMAGKITDQDGKNVEGVEITLMQVDASSAEQVKTAPLVEKAKHLNTSTGENGKYRFVAIRLGYYRVRFAKEGYQTLEKLMEFKRDSKDAVLNIQLQKLDQETTSTAANQN